MRPTTISRAIPARALPMSAPDLAASRAQRFEPRAARANAVVDAHLAPALAGLRGGEPQLAAGIEAIAPHLEWVTYDAYPRDLIGDGFAEGHAFASVIGEWRTAAGRRL